MKTLCVVTTVKDGRAEWLQALGDSLAAVSLPDGWKMVWSVHEDGPDVHGVASEGLVDEFPFCRVTRLDVSVPIATGRNVALHRVPEASAVVNYDGDDVAGPGLGTSLAVLDEDPAVMWVAGPVEDLHEDGTTVAFSQSLVGPVAPGVVSQLWWNRQRLPFHTIGFVARVQPWLTVGGWGAVPTAADSTFGIMALTELHPGFVHNEPVGWWRRHPRQLSFTDDEVRLQGLSWEIIKARVEALRNNTTSS
jgi:hypothetical protein